MEYIYISCIQAFTHTHTHTHTSTHTHPHIHTHTHTHIHTHTHTHTLVGGHINFSKNIILSLLLKTARYLCSILILAVFFLEAAMVINLTAEPAVYICVGKNVLWSYMILVLAII